MHIIHCFASPWPLRIKKVFFLIPFYYCNQNHTTLAFGYFTLRCSVPLKEKNMQESNEGIEIMHNHSRLLMGSRPIT